MMQTERFCEFSLGCVGKRSGQPYKISMCRFYAQGRCQKKQYCTYAHSDGELRPVPNLSKTSLCPALFESNHQSITIASTDTQTKKGYTNYRCPGKGKCRFAHSLREVKKFPTKILFCESYSNNFGDCEFGNYCKYAHSSAEVDQAFIQFHQLQLVEHGSFESPISRISSTSTLSEQEARNRISATFCTMPTEKNISPIVDIFNNDVSNSLNQRSESGLILTPTEKNFSDSSTKSPPLFAHMIDSDQNLVRVVDKLIHLLRIFGISDSVCDEAISQAAKRTSFNCGDSDSNASPFDDVSSNSDNSRNALTYVVLHLVTFIHEHFQSMSSPNYSHELSSFDSFKRSLKNSFSIHQANQNYEQQL